jgi:uncharacterized membrane protein
MSEQSMTEQSPPVISPALPGRGRIDAIDAARGLAIAAMVVFHGAWDLSQAELIATDVSTHQGWQLFARAIAASFLGLVGLSLVLAHGDWFRAGTFRRRWLMVAGAATLVSVGTWYVFPEAWVFFGILHNIALSSLIGLAFLRLPPMLTGLAGIGFIALPFLFRSSFFDPDWLIVTGLGQRVPDSVDFVPVFPWTGWVLLGMAAGGIGRERIGRMTWRAAGRPASWLTMAGRHSLPIYLIHQPVLIGSIWLIAKMLAIGPAATGGELTRFESECVAVCRQSASVEICQRGCACARAEVEKEPALAEALKGATLDARWQARVSEISRTCLK